VKNNARAAAGVSAVQNGDLHVMCTTLHPCVSLIVAQAGEKSPKSRDKSPGKKGAADSSKNETKKDSEGASKKRGKKEKVALDGKSGDRLEVPAPMQLPPRPAKQTRTRACAVSVATIRPCLVTDTVANTNPNGALSTLLRR